MSSRYTDPKAAGALMEADACGKVLKELEHLIEKFKRKVEREDAKRREEFETVMGYASESDIQDAFGWEFITEAQYERYLEIFREGEEALEKHTPTVNERVCEILRSIRGDVMREQQGYRYEAMSPDELRAELKRRQESKREWAERLKAIREKRALAPEECEAYGARGKENDEI